MNIVTEMREFFQPRSPLMKAVIKGDLKEVKKLIKNGADINKKEYNGKTPLMMACYGRYYKIVEFLIESGADINIKDEAGWNALIHAVVKGDIDIIDLLMKEGANPDEKTGSVSALHAAIIKNHVGVVLYLLNRGADVERIVNKGKTPLMEAVLCSNSEIVKLLIKYGADINAKTKDKVTPLGLALFFSHHHKNGQEIFRTLIQNKADPNILFAILLENGEASGSMRPLDFAVMNGMDEEMELLIKAGAKFRNYEDLAVNAYAHNHRELGKYLENLHKMHTYKK